MPNDRSWSNAAETAFCGPWLRNPISAVRPVELAVRCKREIKPKTNSHFAVLVRNIASMAAPTLRPIEVIAHGAHRCDVASPKRTSAESAQQCLPS